MALIFTMHSDNAAVVHVRVPAHSYQALREAVQNATRGRADFSEQEKASSS